MYRRPKISSYVIDRNTIGSHSKSDVNNTAENFPYRKDYQGDSYVKLSLEKIFQIDPIIRKEKWTIPEGRIVTKIQNFKNVYYLLDIVITSVKEHWEYDQIIDYYSEEARVKTPGYGEKYSPLEYWINKKLHSRWNYGNINSLEDARESIYRSMQEARPAYALVSKSLYYALMELNEKDTYKILDIAAYGERAIAAASLGNVSVYDGVDPNYDLISGHDRLLMDLNAMNPNCNIRFIHVGMEDFKTSTKYDIITYSPPPFNVEPYAINSLRNETQSYIKYPTFIEYFCCFLVELIYKAASVSNDNTIFAFSALDRNSNRPSKIKDKDQVSEHLELVYVEALLLVTSCFGFMYKGAIGLAAGGKEAGVPWWIFKYNRSTEVIYVKLLQKYPDIFTLVLPRIAGYYYKINRGLNPLFEEFIEIKETENYKISSYLQVKSNLFLEIVRLQVQQYVIETVSKLSGIRMEKVRVLLGRFLMMCSINATFESPWKSCLFVDPIFPTIGSNMVEICDQFITYLIEQKVSRKLAEEIVYKYKYWFGSYESTGILELYDTIAHYLRTLPLSNISVKTEGNSVIGNSNAINLLKRIPKGKKVVDKVIWQGSVIKNNILAYIRYETLGAHGHQYTRPVEKTKIIEKIFGTPVIDIYASLYNNQSDMYCSIYPDVEDKSIGSAFCLKMIQGAYLANPVDVPIFIEKALSLIIRDLHEAKLNDKRLLVSMNFTVWTDTESNFISDFGNKKDHKELFKNSSNKGLNILSDSEFVIASYILNKNKFPSVLLDKVGNRDSTISVGVLLGSQKDINIDKIIELVEDKKYIQINE